ncbi:GDSL-like lipase/acylhydrolase family protein [Kribbella sp. VKM Ac-2568]|nr:GDSL-like lipase/acylhydrolase family protein [Kribbella sp. VKM Ac-2568]
MGELVVFQGDSITHGGRGETEDPNHVLGHSYPFLIAAEAGATHPDLGRRFVNRGISGHTLAAMTARWQRDVLDLRPDVLSILIGVNDVGSGSWPTPGSPRSPVRRNAVRVSSPAAG